jgi:hypothetical protein
LSSPGAVSLPETSLLPQDRGAVTSAGLWIILGEVLECGPGVCMGEGAKSRDRLYGEEQRQDTTRFFSHEFRLPPLLALDIGRLGHSFVHRRFAVRASDVHFGVSWGSVLPMDGERDHLPGEHLLSELAHLFNPEQAFLFHHLSDCFFRKARLARYPIVQVTPGNGRRVQVVGGDLLYGLSDVFGRVHRESPSVFGSRRMQPRSFRNKPQQGLCAEFAELFFRGG